MSKEYPEWAHPFLVFVDAQRGSQLFVKGENFCPNHSQILPQQISFDHVKLEGFIYIHADFGEWYA